ncbi:MAG: hypothetical protein Q7W45_14295 [Bacteroidota bacterium]|nr:hypothetical protein [Bacteroidota bacterium]MDP3144335.1 hypothetical protein [Bacteroidota bacterium]MDP3556321.1 hypothetical protein [Bacteroidota bacterium]
MKHTTILLGGILFFGLCSCKTKTKTQSSSTSDSTTTGTNKNVTETSTVQPIVYNEVSDKACAAEVSFGSFGAGIDGPAYDKVMTAIKDKKVKYTSKNIGREGETRICLPLTELKENEKKDFIEQLKKIAASGQLVSVSVR